VSPSLTRRVRKGETCPAGLGRGKHTQQGKGGGNIPCRVRKEETCPAGLGRGKHALVRLGLQ